MDAVTVGYMLAVELSTEARAADLTDVVDGIKEDQIAF